jgi:hypothetical protein
LHISAFKTHTARRKRIDMWRFQMWVAGTAQIIKPQLVTHDKEDILAHSVLFSYLIWLCPE